MAAHRRKRPSLVYTGEFWNGDHLEWARVRALDNGMIRPKPSGGAQLAKLLPDPNVAADNLYALNTAQLREDMPANDSIVMYSLQAMMTYLPDEVYDQIYTGEQPGEETDFGDLVTDEAFASNLPGRWSESDRMFRNMKLCQYLFWPINTGQNHYVTLIMVLGKDPAAVKARQDYMKIPAHVHSEVLNTPVPYDQVLQWSVVDPKRGELDSKGKQLNQRERDRHDQRVHRVRRRVRRILTQGGFNMSAAVYSQSTGSPAHTLPWVPPQLAGDDWSSGMRAFALIRKQCDMIVDFHCAEVPFDEAYFWERSPGWLNPHQVRHEMMGLLAVNCVRDMRWKARLAIEPVVNIDGIYEMDRFPAPNLEPKEKPPAYYPQNDFGGGDLTRISNGHEAYPV